MICPFCKNDPFEYVDVGVGFVPVAVTCCDLGYELIRADPTKKARQTLRQMRSYSPRQKARAMKTLREYGLREEKSSV